MTENRFRYDEPLYTSPKDAVDVISFEINELKNTDTITYIYKHYANNKEKILKAIPQKEQTAYKNAFRLMKKAYEGINILETKEFNTERFVKTMLSIVEIATGVKVKYALWLASKNAVLDLYSHGNTNINEYEVGDVILSDLGYDGTLYGYANIPTKINKETEYNLLGYDKDNDTYISFGKSHNLKNLIKIGEMLKTRLLDGTLTHILQNGKTEPIDWLEIYQVDDPSNKKFWTSY